MKILNIEDVLELLRLDIDRVAGQSEWARQTGVSRIQINRALGHCLIDCERLAICAVGPRGGVVTQRSAKPCTPVQFRAWPPLLLFGIVRGPMRLIQ
jgi:hypothetical protein